jgi:hypothetical protein
LELGGAGSHRLIGQGTSKKTHNTDRSSVLVDGIQALLELDACYSVAFLFHWMRGLIATEPVTPRWEQRFPISDLARSIPAIEEDVRYVITRPVERLTSQEV